MSQEGIDKEPSQTNLLQERIDLIVILNVKLHGMLCISIESDNEAYPCWRVCFLYAVSIVGKLQRAFGTR